MACQHEPDSAARSGMERLRRREPWLWINPHWRPLADCAAGLPLTKADLLDAEARLRRFAPLLAGLFEELRGPGGVIESPLLDVPRYADLLRARGAGPAGRVLVKADHALPVAGSVKARGGIYAVLHFAEKLALREGVLSGESDDHRKLAGPEARRLFAPFELTTASTGNLGLSVGLAGAALGFATTVHMSAEAKDWKKRRLREQGVRVVEHGSDYTAACAAARRAAAENPRAHFIDDERSVELFLGYSVAALRLESQLAAAGVRVDAEHPLVLYLPCGVGGAPGGITFGARHVFGDCVDCFLAEPVEAPCMLLGLLTGRGAGVSVYDAGLSLRTDADGLAVARPSGRAAGILRPLVRGCYTVTDRQLYEALANLYETTGIELEPSAAAGCIGPAALSGGGEGHRQKERGGPWRFPAGGTHVVWTTGGRLVPPAQHEQYRETAIRK